MSLRVRRPGHGGGPVRDTSETARADRRARRQRRVARAARPAFGERHPGLVRAGRSARQGGRVVLWPLAFVGTLVALVAISILPTRSYFEQRERIAAAEEHLAQLTDENDDLQRRADRLADPEEIERLARGQHGLVKPGEEVYHVLPPAQDPVAIPDVWPFRSLAQRLGTPTDGSVPPSTSVAPPATAGPTSPSVPGGPSTTAAPGRR